MKDAVLNREALEKKMQESNEAQLAKDKLVSDLVNQIKSKHDELCWAWSKIDLILVNKTKLFRINDLKDLGYDPYSFCSIFKATFISDSLKRDLNLLTDVIDEMNQAIVSINEWSAPQKGCEE